MWDPYRQADIKALEQVQRRAARYVYNGYTSHTPGCITEMVYELGWESLQDRRQISRLSLLYKAHHGLVDIDKATNLIPGDSRTRSHTGFYQEHTVHEVYHNSFPGMEQTTKQCHLSAHRGWLPCLPVHQARPSLNHDQLPLSSYL